MRFRWGAPWLVAGRRLEIGPKGRPWIDLWNCPLHGWHVHFLSPRGHYLGGR